MEELFQEMKTSYDAGNVALKPNFSVYVTRLQAWSKAGNPEMASKVLQEMVLGHKTGLLEKKPVTKEFTAVLQAWLRSNRSNAAEKSEAGLRQMIDFADSKLFDSWPNLFSYTAVISAHAKSNAPDAGERAFSLLRELQRKMAPNFLTYAEVICALSKSSNTNNNNHNTLLRSQEALRQLLQELQSKSGVFWTETRSLQVLRKIQQAIQSSSFPLKQDLMVEFHNLESVASWQGKHNHGYKNPQ
jgi:hypothetical protein